MQRSAILGILVALGFGLVAAPVEAQSARPVEAVATFSILRDLVAAVGGERVRVVSLVAPDSDVHVYEPKPADAQLLASSRIVFVNGLGFEGWLDRLVAASGARAPRVVASAGVTPLRAVDEDGAHAHAGQKAADARMDPHAWQNVANAKIYVANIRDALAAADPEGRAGYEANAAAYLQQLDALEGEIKAAVKGIPVSRRRIITSHDAFGYFADAYGFTFVAPQGVSTDSEASARDVARIIAQIKREKIPAVFVENISNPRLIARIAKETGAAIGDKVYSDSLSAPDGPAGTYIAMMRHNIRAFTQALAR